MAADIDDLKETLLSESLPKQLKFNGLENTDELFCTVKELFSGYVVADSLHIKHIGSCEKFHADIQCNLTKEDDVNYLLEVYMRNIDENLKLSYKRYMLLSYYNI